MRYSTLFLVTLSLLSYSASALPVESQPFDMKDIGDALPKIGVTESTSTLVPSHPTLPQGGGDRVVTVRQRLISNPTTAEEFQGATSAGGVQRNRKTGTERRERTSPYNRKKKGNEKDASVNKVKKWLDGQ